MSASEHFKLPVPRESGQQQRSSSSKSESSGSATISTPNQRHSTSSLSSAAKTNPPSSSSSSEAALGTQIPPLNMSVFGILNALDTRNANGTGDLSSILPDDVSIDSSRSSLVDRLVQPTDPFLHRMLLQKAQANRLNARRSSEISLRLSSASTGVRPSFQRNFALESPITGSDTSRRPSVSLGLESLIGNASCGENVSATASFGIITPIRAEDDRENGSQEQPSFSSQRNEDSAVLKCVSGVSEGGIEINSPCISSKTSSPRKSAGGIDVTLPIMSTIESRDTEDIMDIDSPRVSSEARNSGAGIQVPSPRISPNSTLPLNAMDITSPRVSSNAGFNVSVESSEYSPRPNGTLTSHEALQLVGTPCAATTNLLAPLVILPRMGSASNHTLLTAKSHVSPRYSSDVPAENSMKSNSSLSRWTSIGNTSSRADSLLQMKIGNRLTPRRSEGNANCSAASSFNSENYVSPHQSKSKSSVASLGNTASAAKENSKIPSPGFRNARVSAGYVSPKIPPTVAAKPLASRRVHSLGGQIGQQQQPARPASLTGGRNSFQDKLVFPGFGNNKRFASLDASAINHAPPQSPNQHVREEPLRDATTSHHQVSTPLRQDNVIYKGPYRNSQNRNSVAGSYVATPHPQSRSIGTSHQLENNTNGSKLVRRVSSLATDRSDVGKRVCRKSTPLSVKSDARVSTGQLSPRPRGSFFRQTESQPESIDADNAIDSHGHELVFADGEDELDILQPAVRPSVGERLELRLSQPQYEMDADETGEDADISMHSDGGRHSDLLAYTHSVSKLPRISNGLYSSRPHESLQSDSGQHERMLYTSPDRPSLQARPHSGYANGSGGRATQRVSNVSVIINSQRSQKSFTNSIFDHQQEHSDGRKQSSSSSRRFSGAAYGPIDHESQNNGQAVDGEEDLHTSQTSFGTQENLTDDDDSQSAEEELIVEPRADWTLNPYSSQNHSGSSSEPSNANISADGDDFDKLVQSAVPPNNIYHSQDSPRYNSGDNISETSDLSFADASKTLLQPNSARGSGKKLSDAKNAHRSYYRVHPAQLQEIGVLGDFDVSEGTFVDKVPPSALDNLPRPAWYGNCALLVELMRAQLDKLGPDACSKVTFVKFQDIALCAALQVVAPTPIQLKENQKWLLTVSKARPSDMYILCNDCKLLEDRKCPYEYFALIQKLFPFPVIVKGLVPLYTPTMDVTALRQAIAASALKSP